ncbi:MAG: hypothetical protein M3Q69_13765 [Acidobacteriota bacterium]|nr:hypothetical protein [Acidobacteriota bacterium]
MKRLTIAATLALTAFGAYASNFRGADQVYVPVAGHAAGASGTFISDVYISNLSADPVTISVIYQPFGSNENNANGVGQEFRDAITLRANERKEFLDFFRTALNVQSGFGQLIFNACKSGASCGSEAQDQHGNSANFRPISVETRIYQVTTARPTETTGQLFSGIPWYNFVSSLQNNVGLDRIFITGITNTGTAGTAGTFRTNIGLVNASQYSTTTLVVRLYQGTLDNAGFKQEAQVRLGPLGNVQPGLGALFPGVALGSNYFVTVEQRESTATGTVPADCVNNGGCPAFLAYGSSLDNVSGDATTLEPQFLKELSPEAIDEIYPPAAGKPAVRRVVRH